MPIRRIRVSVLAFSLLCTALVLLTIVPAVSAQDTKLLSAPPVTQGDLAPAFPRISGDTVLFSSWDSSARQPELYLTSLLSGAVTSLPLLGVDDGSFRLSDRWIVFTRPHQPNSQSFRTSTDIFSYDRTSGKEAFIGTSEMVSPTLSLSGDTVVWENGTRERAWPGLTNTRTTLVMKNLNSGNTREVRSLLCDNPSHPVLSEDSLVFEGVTYYPDTTPGKGGAFSSDVYRFDLVTGKESRISSSRTAYRPSVSGPYVVWEDTRNGNPDIYLYDLSKRQEVPLTEDPADQKNPRVSGNWVVWEDKRNQPPVPPVTPCPAGSYCPVETPPPPVTDIFLVDLATWDAACLTCQENGTGMGGNNQGPDVSGHRVVWVRSGGLFLYPLGDVPPQSASPTRQSGQLPIIPGVVAVLAGILLVSQARKK